MDNSVANFEFPINKLEEILSKKAEAQGSAEVSVSDEKPKVEQPKKENPGYVEVPDVGPDITEFLVKKEDSATREDKEQRAQQIGLI